MTAFWMTWKPEGWPIERLRALIRGFHADPETTEAWRIMAHRRAHIGDRAYLFKQGKEPRGIFGVGTIVSDPAVDPAQSPNAEHPQHFVDIRFDELVDPTHSMLLSLGHLQDIVPASRIRSQASGTTINDEIAAELDRRMGLRPTSPPLDPGEAEKEPFNPKNIKDAREKVLREIRARRGQKQFRDALIDAYQGRCVITGCDVMDVLEAAHITPYLGPETNHVTNGLLLRADLHTLFDTYLIAVDPETLKVLVSPTIQDPTYVGLHGQALRATKTKASAPSEAALRKHGAACGF